MADHGPCRTAPFYEIPPRRIVGVEHPAIIRNVDRAIDTLQGSAGVVKILNPPKADAPAHLVLRPEDAMSRPVQSTSSPSNNILLQVTVPKRTGRKRKRGSDEPFIEDPVLSSSTGGPSRPSARQLLRSLRDNEGNYQIEPVGLVDRTHVFRGMPDFVFSTTNSPFISRFREQILPFDYQKMKQFDLDMTKGAISNVDIIPPPSFSHGDVPFSYIYRQNPTVKQSIDTSGNLTTVNTQQAAKVLTYLVPYDITTVPTKPRDNCPPMHTLDATLQETIAAVQALFTTRPAWTRRGLRNSLKTPEQRTALRHAVPYAGYIFRSGPWRDAIIKFGHDPRTSPSSRIYQTTMFRVLPRETELARDSGFGGSGSGGGGTSTTSRRHTIPRPNLNESTADSASTSPTSHLFTGQPPLPRDGRMWMFCDITDPLLHNILFPATATEGEFYRPTCDILCDGWFWNGTLAKAKTIMRSKMQTLFGGGVPDDAEYACILGMPERAFPGGGGGAGGLEEGFWLDAGMASTREMQLAADVRAMIKGAPTWRERGLMGKGEGGLGGRGKRRGVVDGDGDGDHGAGSKEVPSEDEGEDEDEDGDENEDEDTGGEEEAIEQQEILEAATRAVDEAIAGQDEDERASEVD